jgi:hypothetical protein
MYPGVYIIFYFKLYEKKKSNASVTKILNLILTSQLRSTTVPKVFFATDALTARID